MITRYTSGPPKMRGRRIEAFDDAPTYYTQLLRFTGRQVVSVSEKMYDRSPV